MDEHRHTGICDVVKNYRHCVDDVHGHKWETDTVPANWKTDTDINMDGVLSLPLMLVQQHKHYAKLSQSCESNGLFWPIMEAQTYTPTDTQIQCVLYSSVSQPFFCRGTPGKVKRSQGTPRYTV